MSDSIQSPPMALSPLSRIPKATDRNAPPFCMTIQWPDARPLHSDSNQTKPGCHLDQVDMSTNNLANVYSDDFGDCMRTGPNDLSNISHVTAGTHMTKWIDELLSAEYCSDVEDNDASLCSNSQPEPPFSKITQLGVTQTRLKPSRPPPGLSDEEYPNGNSIIARTCTPKTASILPVAWAWNEDDIIVNCGINMVESSTTYLANIYSDDFGSSNSTKTHNLPTISPNTTVTALPPWTDEPFSAEYCSDIEDETSLSSDPQLTTSPVPLISHSGAIHNQAVSLNLPRALPNCEFVGRDNVIASIRDLTTVNTKLVAWTWKDDDGTVSLNVGGAELLTTKVPPSSRESTSIKEVTEAILPVLSRVSQQKIITAPPPTKGHRGRADSLLDSLSASTPVSTLLPNWNSHVH